MTQQMLNTQELLELSLIYIVLDRSVIHAYIYIYVYKTNMFYYTSKIPDFVMQT